MIHCLQGAVIRRLSQHKTAISQKCVNTFASNFGSFTVPNLLLLAVFTQTTQKCNFQKRISQLNKVTHFQLNSGVTIQVCWDIFVAPCTHKTRWRLARPLPLITYALRACARRLKRVCHREAAATVSTRQCSTTNYARLTPSCSLPPPVCRVFTWSSTISIVRCVLQVDAGSVECAVQGWKKSFLNKKYVIRFLGL